MKKGLFWKVIAVIFLCWLFLWLWSNSIIIERIKGSQSMKFNKITGEVQYLTRDGWKDWKERFKDKQ